jgi:hypothetical protein
MLKVILPMDNGLYRRTRRNSGISTPLHSSFRNERCPLLGHGRLGKYLVGRWQGEQRRRWLLITGSVFERRGSGNSVLGIVLRRKNSGIIGLKPRGKLAGGMGVSGKKIDLGGTRQTIRRSRITDGKEDHHPGLNDGRKKDA